MKAMSIQEITVRSRKFDNIVRKSWQCELISRDALTLVLVGRFDEDVEHGGLGSITRGTISHEYYWFQRWYNIFRFHEPDGSLRNYYCNVAMPPSFENGVLDYVDLDIDVVVWPDGKYEVLDRDDFERNAVKYGYPEAIRQKAEQSLTELIAMVGNNELPRAD